MSDTLRRREATFDRASADKKARTIKASLSSEEPVRRGGEVEVLQHDAGAIDLSRAVHGLPLLFSHDRTAPIGVVEGVKVEGRRLVGVLRFSQSARATDIWQDIEDGLLSAMSISYRVDRCEQIDGGVRVTQWAPYEASVVAVPADPTVGVGRADSSNHPEGSNSMPEPTVMTRDQVDANIRGTCAKFKLPKEFADDLVSRQLDLAASNLRVAEELGRRDELAGGHRNINPSRGSYGGSDDPSLLNEHRDQIIEALSARSKGPAMQRDNPYRHARTLDIARERLELRGVRTSQFSPVELIERALTTSDLPELLAGAGNRTLRTAYEMSSSAIKRACKQATSKDFRAKQLLMLGEAPKLLQVNEHGEFRYGATAEAKSAYSLATFGRIFHVTRQALVNDDLDAFGDMAIKLGRAAADLEAQQLVALLTSNPAMGYDSVALFHASHGNLGTGAGSALQVTALDAARKAMRLQKGLDGVTPIDATPKFLIVPAALETTAEQLLTAILANQVSQVNPFANKLELIVEPRLDAVSAAAWYLAADPAVIDTLEYSYLEGEEGPQIFTQEGWVVDGMQIKVREDFGAGAIDHRGLYKANGA